MSDKVIKKDDFIVFKMKHPKLGLQFVRRKIIEVETSGFFKVKGKVKGTEIIVNPSDVIRHVPR